jgi:hypothetical protein
MWQPAQYLERRRVGDFLALAAFAIKKFTVYI